MSDITQIAINGTVYDIKDVIARADLAVVKPAIQALQANVGDPIPTSSFGSSLNTSKVYIYIGTTDANYTQGHWYYYNGSAWTDGGDWGDGVTIDDSLSNSGQAADAKVTGDIIQKNFFEIQAANNKIFSLVPGVINNQGQENTNNATYLQNRKMNKGYVPYNIYSTISCTNDYRFVVAYYSNIGQKYFISRTDWLDTTIYQIPYVENAAYIRISVKRADENDFAENEMPVISYIKASSALENTKNNQQSISEMHHIIQETCFESAEVNTGTFTLEPGWINDSGQENTTTANQQKRKRNDAYVPYHIYSTISWPNDYLTQVIYYSNTGQAYFINKTDWLDVAEYQIPYVENAAYIRITVQRADGNDFVENEMPVISYRAQNRITDLIQEEMTGIDKLNWLSNGLLLSVDSYTHTVTTASTWQRKSWTCNGLSGDKINIKYDSISYDNVALGANNFRVQFYSEDNATGDSLGVQYVNYKQNVDISFDIPGGAKSALLSVYVNTTSTNNLSVTITGLKAYQEFNGEGTAHLNDSASAMVGYLNFPDYYKEDDYLNAKAAVVDGLIKNSGGNYDAFIYITDTHWDRNAHKSPALISWLERRLKINKLVIGGDLYDCWNGITQDGFNQFYNAFHGMKFGIPGNHEYVHVANNISAGGLSPGEIWHLFNGENDHLLVGNAERCYFAYDNHSQKIRYIFLNVFDDAGPSATDAVYNFEEAQQTWYRDVALGQMPEDYTAVVIAHTVYKLTNPISLPDATQPVIDIADDFVSNGGEIACIIHGHTHKDRMVITSEGIPVFVVACDKYIPWYNNGVPDINVTRTAGTITEQAFEIVVIDKKNRLVSLVRIGAPALDGVDSGAGDPVEIRQQTFGTQD